jgi:hypothetical protein
LTWSIWRTAGRQLVGIVGGATLWQALSVAACDASAPKLFTAPIGHW